MINSNKEKIAKIYRPWPINSTADSNLVYESDELLKQKSLLSKKRRRIQ